MGEHWKPILRRGGIIEVRDKRTGKVRYGFITTINGVKHQRTCFINEKDAESALAALRSRQMPRPMNATPERDAGPAVSKRREKKETLAAYVQRVRHQKGFSLTDVEVNSGRRISNAYVSRIENGHFTNPSRSKLFALARGLQVTPDLFEIAFGSQVEAEDQGFRDSSLFLLHQRLETTPPERRQLVEAMIEMIINDLDSRHRAGAS